MSETNIAQLPHWRCHKVVQAAKITGLENGADGLQALLLEGGVRVPASPAWMQKHNPYIGGYFVRYEDGYESYSPAAAFEAGHTLLPELGTAGRYREKPAEWFNQCHKTVPEALRYLAEQERPSGGEERFNSAHLHQMASEIEHMAKCGPFLSECTSGSDEAKAAQNTIRNILVGVGVDPDGQLPDAPLSRTVLDVVENLLRDGRAGLQVNADGTTQALTKAETDLEDAEFPEPKVDDYYAPHQQRVLDERADLDERLTKLNAFLDGETFGTLPEDEQARLLEQADLMAAYLDVLMRRIERF